jgi:hypothetical protein
MEQTIEKYDQAKIDSIRRFLESKVGKVNKENEPMERYYEIYVDNLKVVERTNDLDDFCGYMDFLQDGTKEVRIIIYTASATAPKVTSKHIFKMQAEEPKKETGLSGVEVQNLVSDGITQAKLGWDYNALEQKYAEALKDLKDANEYADSLEKAVEELKLKKNSTDINIGNALSIAAEGLLRRNVHLLAKIPMAKGLAGILAEDNERGGKQEESSEQPVSETSFKEKEPEQSLSNEEKQVLQFVKGMQRTFSDDQLGKIQEIIHSFAADKCRIMDVIAFLNTSQK